MDAPSSLIQILLLPLHQNRKETWLQFSFAASVIITETEQTISEGRCRRYWLL
jgi:hypothetical protein